MEPAIYYGLAAVLVAVGLVGTVVPVLPGTILVFAGLLLAAWADGFAHVGPVGLGVIGALLALSLAIDLIGSVLGAKRVGASPQALAGATLGGVVGILFGIPGLILGPFVGAVGGELLARSRLTHAGRVGFGTWVGLVAAAVLKVVIAFLMIATFFAFYIMNS